MADTVLTDGRRRYWLPVGDMGRDATAWPAIEAAGSMPRLRQACAACGAAAQSAERISRTRESASPTPVRTTTQPLNRIHTVQPQLLHLFFHCSCAQIWASARKVGRKCPPATHQLQRLTRLAFHATVTTFKYRLLAQHSHCFLCVKTLLVGGNLHVCCTDPLCLPQRAPLRPLA